MKKYIHTFTFICVLLATMLNTSCNQEKSTEIIFERVSPESVGMSSEKLANADAVINAAIAERVIPGAVLAVIKNSKYPQGSYFL